MHVSVRLKVCVRARNFLGSCGDTCRPAKASALSVESSDPFTTFDLSIFLQWDLYM
jgi:hypothetical protein